jgi:hypothetical protein
MLQLLNISVCGVGKKSLYTHTICTQNQFNFVQHSSHRFHSVLPNEIVMVVIIGDSSAMAKNARPREESLESEAILPNFHE